MRGRPKKKESNPKQSMEELLQKAVELYAVPYDDRDGRDIDLPSLNYVAAEMGTTILRVRKFLITAEYFTTILSRTVQDMIARGMTVEEVMAATGLGKASVYSYIPYKGLAFNLDQTTVNADRHKLFRARLKAIDELQEHMGLPNEMEFLWKCVITFEGYPFRTSGRGRMPGVKFTYSISRTPNQGGRHYDGYTVEGYGNELKFSTKEKTVTRATVELAYKKALEVQIAEGCVSGPKKIGSVFGASYLYPMLVRFGVIRASTECA